MIAMLSAAGNPALPLVREWQLSLAGQITALPAEGIRPIIHGGAPAVRKEDHAHLATKRFWRIIRDSASVVCNEDRTH
jgi:hypothetical protein